MEFTWTIQDEISFVGRPAIDSMFYIEHIVYCYYCENCGTFGRSNSPKEGKHNIIHYDILMSAYRSITDGLVTSTEHGSGWYISPEELEKRMFDILL